MALPPLNTDAIVLDAHADDWRAAVRIAGAALTRTGATTEGYADEMIRMIEEHGPYVVIAPGLAMAHARPGPAVLADGLSVVTLAKPVAFGHPYNDPVRVVLGLAIRDVHAHLPSIATIANIFNDSGAVTAVACARTAEQVLDIMGADG